MTFCQSSLNWYVFCSFSSVHVVSGTATEFVPIAIEEDMAKKVTSPKVAKIASKVLRDGRYSDAAKSAAGSALSQREKKKK